MYMSETQCHLAPPLRLTTGTVGTRDPAHLPLLGPHPFQPVTQFSRELAEMAGYAWALPWRTVQTGCLLSLSLGREHASGAGG
ncbi:unnamed protein product [Gadus morhua 'NCC']